jgi:hypothetical protein
MLVRKILAVVILVGGVASFGLPLPLGLGWLMALVGFVLGEALGVMAGMMWYLADQVPPTTRRVESPPVLAAMEPQP